MDEDDILEESGFNGGSGSSKIEFLGSYSHSIDAKGRIIIPNAYRLALGAVLTIGPTRDFKGIALYPDAVFNQILEELNEINPRKAIVQTYTMQFYKLCYRDMQPDGQGRLLLPPKLRQRMLGEAKDLEISGGFNHVRIMDAEQANRDDEDFMRNLDDILDKMGNMDPQ